MSHADDAISNPRPGRRWTTCCWPATPVGRSWPAVSWPRVRPSWAGSAPLRVAEASRRSDRLPGRAGVEGRHRRRARRILRRGPVRLGRPRRERPGVQERREQHACRPGASGRDAPRRHPLLPLPLGSTSSTRGLLVMNHEYTDDGLLHPGGMEPWTPEKVAKSQAAHGVSVVEVTLVGDHWQVDRSSALGRRITARTPMKVSGPAAGHALVRTGFDPDGRTVLGHDQQLRHGRDARGDVSRPARRTSTTTS